MAIQRGLNADDESGYPLYIRAAFGEDRSWMEGAACKPSGNISSDNRWWWTCDPGRYYHGIRGSKWIEMAEMICSTCPVQYKCVRWAIDVNEFFTWGVSEENRRALRRMPDLDARLEEAEAAGVSVLALVRSVKG